MSIIQARVVGRSGRGGVGNVWLKARPKIKQKKQKRQEEAPKSRKRRSMWKSSTTKRKRKALIPF